MRLTDYLRPTQILAHLEATARDDVLDAISELAARVDRTADPAEIAKRLKAREEEHTTVLGEGIAIPHATVPSLSAPMLLLALAPEPIEFGPEGSGEVDVFFSLLSPPDGQREHIKILARICRIARDPGLGEALRSGGEAVEVFTAFQAIDERHV